MRTGASFLLALWLTTGSAAAQPPDEGPEEEKANSEVPNGRRREEPVRAVGDEAFGADEPAGGYTFRTLLQVRQRQTFPTISPGLARRVRGDQVDDAMGDRTLEIIRDTLRDGDGFSLNRAFLRATAQPTEGVGFKLMVDFAELARGKPRRTLKLAFLELAPVKRWVITVGLFKIPYSLLELLPAAAFELAESGPTDALIKDLGFGGRDLGAVVTWEPLEKKRWLTLTAGAFGGETTGAQPYRGPGMLAARVTSRPWKRLRLGADVAWRPASVHDFEEVGGVDVAFQRFTPGVAVSTDVSLRVKKLEVRAEWLTGDRTDTTIRSPGFELRRGDARTFMAAWGIVSYRMILNGVMLLPALRAEWLDADRQHPVGRLVTLSAALTVDLEDRLRLLLDVSHALAQPGTLSLSVPQGRFDADATSVTLQLQAKL